MYILTHSVWNSELCALLSLLPMWQPSPKTPDFKHKSTNEALWIVSKKTPSWVPGQLEKLEAAKQKFIASGGGMPRQSNSISGVDFKDF